MKFSIVIPTYNEENDIRDTIEAALAVDYPEKEIIVVDDSSDKTPDIVREYQSKGVRLIRPEKKEGRCGARNIGIKSSTGDIVVILNADVRLPNDFLNKISKYYKEGYDYVLVKAKVSNDNDLFARYVDAVASADESGDPSWMEWTEGFSCRKDVAIKAGLFPTGFAVPICAGEDGFFGNGLRSIGAKKKIDFSIVINHVSPATFKEYWYIRKGRGKGCPQIRFFLDKWSVSKIVLWAFLRIIKNLIIVLPVFPMLAVTYRGVRFSKYGIRDWMSFTWAWLVEQTAFHVGEWQSIFEIVNAQKVSSDKK